MKWFNVAITSTATRPADGSAIARPRVDAMARGGKGVKGQGPGLVNVLWGDVHMTQVFTAHLREHDHTLSSSSSRSKRTMGGRQNYIGDRSEHHERYGADTDSRAVLLLTPYSLLTRTCRDSDEPNGWRAPLRPDTQTHEHAHVHAAAAHVTSRL